MKQMRKIRRVHALTNSFSGVAAEARVAAEMVRCGLRAAKPYWTDDEVDLIVLWRNDRHTVLPIPVQVKAIQFLDSKSRSSTAPRFVSNLKKRYVENNPALCLAIYRPDTDAIWFIDGAENVRKVYDEDAKKTHRTRYRDLKREDNVRIRLTAENCKLDSDWRVPADDAKWLADRLSRIAKTILNEQGTNRQLSELLDRILR